MAKREALVTDEQWKQLDPSLLVHRQSPNGDRKPRSNREFWKVPLEKPSGE